MHGMDLVDFLSSQSPVFYAAALAVAAGTTLLVLAAFQQLRRLSRSGTGKPAPLPERAARPKELVLGRKLDLTDQPSDVFGSPQREGVHAAPGLVPSQQARLANLLDRLQDLASQLEEFRSEMAADSQFQKAFSGLKTGGDGVEYLYRQEMS